jgi:hypothetical protein
MIASLPRVAEALAEALIFSFFLTRFRIASAEQSQAKRTKEMILAQTIISLIYI